MQRTSFRLLAALACCLFLHSHRASAQFGALPHPAQPADAGNATNQTDAATTNQVDKIVTNAPPSQSVVTQPPAKLVPPGFTVATNQSTPPKVSSEKIVLPPSVPDPIERVNRVMWDFNRVVMSEVIKPTGRAYRLIVRKPMRRGITNFGRNATYPGRLINNLLQGKWAGARNETDRFFFNTLLGGAGFFDVAKQWQIPKSDADFGETFASWGWKPSVFLMLPIYGPSNERDTTGLIADIAANPITYFPPYSYYSLGVSYNNLTDGVDEYVRFAETEKDPYSVIQYAWTFARENQVANFQVKGKQDEASLETLESVFFTYKQPEFPNQGRTRSVRIPATGKELKYTYWLQPKKAPLVYIVPGLGSHRLADASLALAELAYKNGFSAVSVSSTYNYEFMEQASTAAMPAYTPVDAHDVHVALSEIDHQLTKLYPDRLGARALMGYSMGAFQSLFIAATSASNQPAGLIKFDRVIGINTPVRLIYGISKLDEFYEAPLTWPSEERTKDIHNTFLKVSALTKTSLRPQTSLPFDAVESKFLIGLTFRFFLRDIIYSSQQRYDQGVLKHPIKALKREPLYEEILQYCYQDYFKKFVVPYYQTRGVDLTSPTILEQASDLRTHAASLHADPTIRLIVNQNDFLLPEEDLTWLRQTFPPEQMTIFEKGGHLGNLSHSTVQKAIVGALADLLPPGQKPK